MRIDEFLECLRDVLRWENPTFSQEVGDFYNRRLAEGVDAAVAVAAEHDSSAAETACLLLQVLTDAQYLDFIAAPYIASMIVSPAILSRGDRRRFFLRTLGMCAGCISDDAAMYNIAERQSRLELEIEARAGMAIASQSVLAENCSSHTWIAEEIA